ncbi:hypothetical protein [Bradyrhizobium sp. SZCCHNRI1029]|uniref:hypothetical protein n=1 Tax=Bradyrhizobium sp. SZCCHNRI1029 TaxID=3057278 RepID=UPI002916AE2D|nr:hypothetical protein [Bradyrhizobium sp. SZCCHNRI1029]
MPGLPCALDLEGGIDDHHSGIMCRENAAACSFVILVGASAFGSPVRIIAPLLMG